MKKEQIKKILSKNISKAIIGTVLWALIITILSLYATSVTVPGSWGVFLSYLKKPFIVGINMLPVLALTLIFAFITNKLWVSYLLSGLITLIMTAVNYLKIMIRNDPFVATDFTLINEAMNIGQRYTFVLHPFFYIAAGIIIAGVIASKFLLKYRIRKKFARPVGLIAVIIIFMSLFSHTYLSGIVYSKFKNVGPNPLMNALDSNDQFASRGFVYSFLHSINDYFEPAPKGYSKEKAKEALKDYPYDNIPEDKKVNIISIMLESFNDFSKYDSIEFSRNPYEYLYELREKSIYGQVFTTVFGGGTVKSERSFLTGFSYQSDYRRPTNSYVHYMKQQGYTVEGSHPGNKWFYKRDMINKFLGFDNYKFFEDGYSDMYYSNPHVENPANIDPILDDKYLFADIMDNFEANKATGKPYFNFSVSYQNHGPYDPYYVLNETEYAVQSETLSNEGYNIINNYLAGIEKTLEALKTMIAQIDASEEPIMLVLFGDHNPWLGDESYVYEELGIELELAEGDGIYNYYCTPYIIYTNSAAKEITGNQAQGYGGDFSLMYLMNKVFETNGWKGNEFIKATNALKERIDILTGTGLYRENGAFTLWPSGKTIEALDKFRYVQYYWRNETAPKTPEEIAAEQAS